MQPPTGPRALSGRSAAVVGGGFGGLSAACYLARAGADVTLLEKNEQLGGRASRLERDGFRFDMGPSWYLMPDVFESFFGDFDRRPDDYYELRRLDPHYRILFKDGDRVDMVPDREANRRTFESYEPGAGEAFDRYLEKSARNYEIGMEYFVYEDRPRLRDFVDPDVVRHARGLSLLGSMQDHVERYFDHPKLQQIVQYSLVFLGGSPRNTPALYNLMSHVDFNLGVYYPVGVRKTSGLPSQPGSQPGSDDVHQAASDAAGRNPSGSEAVRGSGAPTADGSQDQKTESAGGIGAVVDGIAALGEELGVEFRCGAPVREIRGRRGAFAVRTDDDEFFPDLVVSNADYAHTEQELLPPEKRQYDAEYWETRTYAPSAFLLYLGVEGDVEPLAHHTLVLPPDWDDHFAAIFDDPSWPDDPAYYLCVPSRTDDDAAPEGHSSLFALVPIAPDLDDDPETRGRYRDHVLDDIAESAGVELRDRIVVEESFCVSDFADRYNATRGTALGLAHTLRQTAPFRPPHASRAMDGLYFAGAYTTPGIGVPMCLISGRLTVEAMIEREAGAAST